MEKEVLVESVNAFQTKSGNTRYVLRDADGYEYTTFKEAIAAAPYLLGATEAKKPVAPDELFEKLKPFQERVADDIRDGDDEPSET